MVVTVDEARAILGPEIAAKVEAQAATHPPLTPEQIALLVRLLSVDDPDRVP